MTRVCLFVKGRVQGVGFRFFTSRTAKNLGLKGFVRNLPDGRVKIVAEGSREMLDRLVKQVAEGPITADVEEVKTEWGKETNEFSTFEIRF